MTDPVALGRTSFGRHGYAVLSGLVADADLPALRQYHRRLVADGALRFGDGQCARRYAAADEPAATYLQARFLSLMAQVAGLPVTPSYAYTARYEEGAELLRHVDRAACEFSISLCIDFEPDPGGAPTPWPLWLDTSSGPVAIRQRLGDGLFYRGRILPHYRHRLPRGCRSTSLFLHYVRAAPARSRA